MVQLSLWDESQKKLFADKLLGGYRKGEYDLPSLAIMLLDISVLDVADFIQRSIPHSERYQAVEKIKKNNKLPVDGVSRLENLFLGECENRGKGGIEA